MFRKLQSDRVASVLVLQQNSCLITQSSKMTLLTCIKTQEKSNEKAVQELLKKNEAITKTINESKEQLEQRKEVHFWRFKNKICYCWSSCNL